MGLCSGGEETMRRTASMRLGMPQALREPVFPVVEQACLSAPSGVIPKPVTGRAEMAGKRRDRPRRPRPGPSGPESV